jgi:hypothetical protein
MSLSQISQCYRTYQQNPKSLTPQERISLLEDCVNHHFGYGSLDVDFVAANRDACIAAVRRNKWFCVKGSLGISFSRERPQLHLEFGNKLEKQEVKRLVKEIKKADATEASLSS